jgi:hypothetical protein
VTRTVSALRLNSRMQLNVRHGRICVALMSRLCRWLHSLGDERFAILVDKVSRLNASVTDSVVHSSTLEGRTTAELFGDKWQ